jgi:hypothetical protein
MTSWNPAAATATAVVAVAAAFFTVDKALSESSSSESAALPKFFFQLADVLAPSWTSSLYVVDVLAMFCPLLVYFHDFLNILKQFCDWYTPEVLDRSM